MEKTLSWVMGCIYFVSFGIFFFIFQLEVGVTNLVGIVPLFVGIVGMTNISPHTLVVRGRQRAHKLVSQCICIVSVFVLVLRDHTG